MGSAGAGPDPYLNILTSKAVARPAPRRPPPAPGRPCCITCCNKSRSGLSQYTLARRVCGVHSTASKGRTNSIPNSEQRAPIMVLWCAEPRGAEPRGAQDPHTAWPTRPAVHKHPVPRKCIHEHTHHWTKACTTCLHTSTHITTSRYTCWALPRLRSGHDERYRERSFAACRGEEDRERSPPRLATAAIWMFTLRWVMLVVHQAGARETRTSRHPVS
jgi:hypothetical protein